MKRLSILGFILLTINAWGQTTRIVNNNPGATPGVNVYTGATALQNAINASVSGDIIHVVATTVSNGDVTITDKSLTIMGVGLNPQKGVGTRSLVGNIAINGVASSGTRLSGLHMGRYMLANDNTPIHSISNLLVENCEIKSVEMYNNSNSIGNMIIRNCVVNTAPGFSSAPGMEFFISSGVLITNNIIRCPANTASSIAGNGLTITNNLFYSSGTFNAFINLNNSTVQNNIFSRTSPAVNILNSTGNQFLNNIAFGSTDNTFTIGTGGNTGSGNLSADPKMTNVPSTSSFWVYTYDITLLAGSPAINAGLDGKNMGPTGGMTPFDPEGTLLPLIEAINMPAIVTKGVDLEVNVKAKGN